jgi:hypothetical protein
MIRDLYQADPRYLFRAFQPVRVEELRTKSPRLAALRLHPATPHDATAPGEPLTRHVPLQRRSSRACGFIQQATVRSWPAHTDRSARGHGPWSGQKGIPPAERTGSTGLASFSHRLRIGRFTVVELARGRP